MLAFQEAKRVIAPHKNCNDLDKAQICFKVVDIEAKMKFLSICMKRHILHPSNDKKGIDFDLLLLQQSAAFAINLKL